MSGCDFPVMTQADVAALAALEKREAHKEALRRMFASKDKMPTLAFVLANDDDWQRCDAQHAAKMALIRAAWPLYQKRKGSLPLIRLSGRHVPNRARHMPRTLRNDLSLFSDIHWHETLSQGAVHLMSSACVRAWRVGRLTPSSLRPRRVTAGGLVIVRGRR